MSAPRPRLRRYPGIDAVSRELVQLINRERSRPEIRTLLRQLAEEGKVRRNGIGHPDLSDFEGVAQALYTSVVRRVTYTRDPERVELIQAPTDTLGRSMGDCEDMVVLGGSLLSSVGVPVRIVLVGYDPKGASDAYDHTYLEYDAGRGWRAWDPTLASQRATARAGDRAPQREVRRRTIDVVRGGSFGLAGLGALPILSLNPLSPTEPSKRVLIPTVGPATDKRTVVTIDPGPVPHYAPPKVATPIASDTFVPRHGAPVDRDAPRRPVVLRVPPIADAPGRGLPGTVGGGVFTFPDEPEPEQDASADELGGIPVQLWIGGAVLALFLFSRGGLSAQKARRVDTTTSTTTTDLGRD